jgi:hypothetical protein
VVWWSEQELRWVTLYGLCPRCGTPRRTWERHDPGGTVMMGLTCANGHEQ